MEDEIIKKSASEKRIKHLEKVGFKKEVERLRKDYSNTNRFKQIKHKQRSKSLKAIPLAKISKNSGNFLQATKIISVTASKWAIFDYYSMKYIRGYRVHDPFPLSVFSKLLVFATVNTIVTKNKIDITRFQNIVTETTLKVHKNSNSNSSSYIKLNADDILTLQDLLHVLLLSDAQEAELVLAVNLGAYLLKKRKKEYYSVYDADDNLFKTHIKQFYQFVSSYCQTMKFENIKYVEFMPKLKNEKNKCTAYDITALSIQCLKMPLFQKIMRRPQVEIQIKYINDEGTITQRKQMLVNKTIHNKFLPYFNVCRNWDEKQFMDSHCSVFYEEEALQPIVLVILGSYSPNDRQKDIQQIIEWYIKNYSKKKEVPKIQETPIQIKKHQQSKLMPRFKTQHSTQLQTILQQKLNGSNNKNSKFKINPVKKSIVRLNTEGNDPFSKKASNF